MKKIYFDGCSYTYGQGLELYCNPLDIFKENRMSHYKFTNKDLEFISKNRYSGIVSNHFNFIEINKSKNGKSNGLILFELENQSLQDYNYLKTEKLENYKYIIIQLTHFNRYFTEGFEWYGNPHRFIKYKQITITQEQIDYTINNIENIQLNYFLELENIFKDFPEKLKIIFHSNEWEDILSKEQIEKYGISIDGEYMIRRWAEKNNMFINQQPEFKKHKSCKYDTHLCIEGHKILAQSIIKQL